MQCDEPSNTTFYLKELKAPPAGPYATAYLNPYVNIPSANHENTAN